MKKYIFNPGPFSMKWCGNSPATGSDGPSTRYGAILREVGVSLGKKAMGSWMSLKRWFLKQQKGGDINGRLLSFAWVYIDDI